MKRLKLIGLSFVILVGVLLYKNPDYVRKQITNLGLTHLFSDRKFKNK